MLEVEFNKVEPMHFQEVVPMSREDALDAFASNDVAAICNALIRITYHDLDWRWVQEQCTNLAQFPNADVRGLAATCLGHLARIHGNLDLEQALSTFKFLSRDADIAPRVLDAIADIKVFMKADLSEAIKN